MLQTCIMVAMCLDGMLYTKMEDKTKLTIGAIITLVLVIGGTYYVADTDQAYYCEAKDMVMICEKLSSGLGTRCYFEDTYKICKEGWVKMELGDEVIPKEVSSVPGSPDSTPGKKWLCSPEGCIKIE